MNTSDQLLFDFTPQADLRPWRVVDDVVMGGRSSGSFQLSKQGHGLFSGEISLENNGGFSSVRYQPERTSIGKCTKVLLYIKGDGKRYQFRVKHRRTDYHSYLTYFETSGDWEVIELPLQDFYPSFRGQRLKQPNFNHEYMEEIAFLLGNKEAQHFRLLIDKIVLR